MADTITQQLVRLGYVDEKVQGKRDFETMKSLNMSDITQEAERLCKDRNYPLCLAHKVVSR